MQFIPDVMGRSVDISDDPIKRSLVVATGATMASTPMHVQTATAATTEDPVHNAVLAAVDQYLSTGDEPHPAFAASSSNFLARPPLRRAHHPSFSMRDDGGKNDRPHETVPIPLSVSDRYSFQSHYMKKLAMFYEQHFDAENRISGCGAAGSGAESAGAFSSTNAGSLESSKRGGRGAASKRVSSVVDLIKRRWKPGMPLGVFTATYNTALCNSMLPKRNTKASPHVTKENKNGAAAEPFAGSDVDDDLDSLSMSDAPSSSSSLDHTGSFHTGSSHLNATRPRGGRGGDDGPLNNNPSKSKSAKRKDVQPPSSTVAKDAKAKKPPKGDASFNTMDLEEIRSLLVRPNAHVIVLATQEHGPYVPMGKTWNEKASKNKHRWGRKQADRRLHKVRHHHNAEMTHFEEFDAKVQQAMRRRVAANGSQKTAHGNSKTVGSEFARSQFTPQPIVHNATGTFTINSMEDSRGGGGARRSDVTTLGDGKEGGDFSDAGSGTAGSDSLEEGRARGDHPSEAVHEDYSTLPHHLVYNPDDDTPAASPLKGGPLAPNDDHDFHDASTDRHPTVEEEVLIRVGDSGAVMGGAASREESTSNHPHSQSRLLPPSGLSDVSSDDDIFYSAARKASGGVLVRVIPSQQTKRSTTLLGVGGKRHRPSIGHQPKASSTPSVVDGCRIQNPVALRRRLYRYTNLRSAVGEVAALLEDNRESMTRYSRSGAVLDPKDIRSHKRNGVGGWCCTSADNDAVDGKPTMELEASALTKQAVPPPRRAMPLLRWASTTASRAAANEIHDAGSVTGSRRAHELIRGDALRSQTTTSLVSVSEGGGRSSTSSFSAPNVLYTKRDLMNKRKEVDPTPALHTPTPSELNATSDANHLSVVTEEASAVMTTSHLLPHYYKDVLSYIDDQCRRGVKGYILTNSSEGIHGVAGGMGCMSGGGVGEAHELLVSSSSSSASTGGPSRCSSCERAADAKEAAEELEATGPSIAEQARQRQLRQRQLGLGGARGGAKKDASHSTITKEAMTNHRSTLYGLLDPYVLPNPRDGVYCSLHQTKITEKAIATKRRRDAKAHRFNVSRTKENRALEDIHSGGSVPFAAPTDLSPEVDVAGASLYHRRWQKDVVLGGCLNNYKGNRQLQRIALRRAEVTAASAGASATYIASKESAPMKWSTGGGRNAAVIALARRALGVKGNATPASKPAEARRVLRSPRGSTRIEGTWEDAHPIATAPAVAGPSGDMSPTTGSYVFPKFLGAESVNLLKHQHGSPHMSASSNSQSTNSPATTVVPPAPRMSSLLHHYTLVTSNSMTSMHIGVYVRTCDVLPYIKRSAIIGGGAKSGDPSKAAGKGYSGAPDGLHAPLGNPRTTSKLDKACARAKLDLDREPLDHLTKADSNSHYFPFDAGSDPKQVFREQEGSEEDAGLKEGCTTVKTGMLGGMVGNKGGVAVEITLDMVRRAEDDTAFYQTAVKMRMITAERETLWRRRRLEAENKARVMRNKIKGVAKEQSVRKWTALIEQVRKGAPADTRHHHTNVTLPVFQSGVTSPAGDDIPSHRTLLQFARSEGLGDPAHKGGDSSSDEDTMPSSDFSDSCSSEVSSSDSLPSERDIVVDDQMASSISRRVGNALLVSSHNSIDMSNGDMQELFGPLAVSNRDSRPPTHPTHPTPVFARATPRELRRGGFGALPPPPPQGDVVTLPLTRAQKIRYRAKRAHIKALERNRRQEEHALMSSLVPHYHSSNNLVGLAAIARLRRFWKASERDDGACKPTSTTPVAATSSHPHGRNASLGAFGVTAEISGMFDSPPALDGKKGVHPLSTEFSPSAVALTAPNTTDVSPVMSGASSPTHASSPNRPPRAPRNTSSPVPQNPSSPMVKMPTFDAIVPRAETVRLHTDALYRHLEDELATIGDDEAMMSQSDTDGENDELNESAPTINPRPKRVAQQDVPGAKLRASELVYRGDKPPVTGEAGVLSNSIQQQLYEDPVAREERRVWARLYHHRCYLQFVRCRLKAAMLELDRTGGLTPTELDATQDILAKRLRGVSLQRITCVDDGLSDDEKQRRDQEDVVVSFLFSHESPSLADMQPSRNSSSSKGVTRFMVTSFPFGAAASSGIFMFGTRAAEQRLGGMNRKYLLDTSPQVEGSLTGNASMTDNKNADSSKRVLKRAGVSGGHKEVIRSVRVQDGDDPGATILTPSSLQQISLMSNQGPAATPHSTTTHLPIEPSIPSMGALGESSSLREGSGLNQIETFYNRRNMSVHRERQDRFAASVGDTVSATMSTVRRPPGGGGGGFGMADSIPFTASRPRGGGLVAFVDAPEPPSQSPPSAGLPDEGPQAEGADSPRNTAATGAPSLTPFTLPPPEPTTELTLLFIGAHLTAHDHHLEKRNHDYWRIVTLLSTGTRASTNPGGLGYTAGFVRSRTARRLLERRLRQLHREQVAAMEAGKPEIKASAFHHARDATEEPDACFFMGDLNYRLRGSNKGLQRLVAQATAPPRVNHKPPQWPTAAPQPATPASVVSAKPPSTTNRQTAVSFSPGEGAIARAQPASRGFEAKSILQNALSVAATNRHQQMGTDSGAIPISAEALGDALASSLHRANQDDIAHLVAELKSHKPETVPAPQNPIKKKPQSPQSSDSFDSSVDLTPEVRNALAKILEEREWSAYDEDAWSDDDGTSSSSSSEDEAAIVIRAETLAANDQLLLEMSGKAPRLIKMRNKLAAKRIKEAQAKGEDLEAAARGYLNKNPAYNYDQRLVFNGFKEAGRLLFAPSYKFKLHPMAGEEGSVSYMDVELSRVWRGMVGEYFRGADVPVRYDPSANPEVSRKDSVGSARRALYSLLTDVRGCVTAILAQRDQYTHRHPNIEARATAAMRRGDFELVDELLSDIVFAGLTRVMCGIMHSEHTSTTTAQQRSPNNSFHFFQANETLSSFRPRPNRESSRASIGSVSGAAGGGDPDDFMPLTFVQALSEMSLWPQKVAEQQAAAFAKYTRSLRRSSRASMDSSAFSPTSGVTPQLHRHKSNLRRGSRVIAPLASPEMTSGVMGSVTTERETSTVSVSMSRRGPKTQEQTAQEKAFLHVVREVIMRDAATLVLRLAVEHTRCDTVGYGGAGGGPHPSKSSLHGSLLLSAGVFCSYFRDHPSYKSVPYLCTPHWHSQPMLYDDKRLPSYCDRILVRVNNDQTVGEALGRGVAGNVGRHAAPAVSPVNSTNAPLSSTSGSDAPVDHAVSLPVGAPEDMRPAVVVDTVAYTSVPRTSTSDHMPVAAYFVVHAPFYFSPVSKDVHKAVSTTRRLPPTEDDDMWASACSAPATTKFTFRKRYWATPYLPPFQPRPQRDTLFSSLLWVYYRNQVLLAQWEDDQEAYYEAQERALGVVIGDTANRLLR